MPDYRAYVIGDDGHIIRRIDLIACANDDVAKEKAKQLVDGYAIELWDGARRITRFDPRQ